MEVFADLLSIPIEDMGRLSFEVDEEPEPVSSTCVVFAKSEVGRLLSSECLEAIVKIRDLTIPGADKLRHFRLQWEFIQTLL